MSALQAVPGLAVVVLVGAVVHLVPVDAVGLAGVKDDVDVAGDVSPELVLRRREEDPVVGLAVVRLLPVGEQHAGVGVLGRGVVTDVEEAVEVGRHLQPGAQPPPAFMGADVRGVVQLLEDRAVGVRPVVGRVLDPGAGDVEAPVADEGLDGVVTPGLDLGTGGGPAGLHPEGEVGVT